MAMVLGIDEAAFTGANLRGQGFFCQNLYFPNVLFCKTMGNQ